MADLRTSLVLDKLLQIVRLYTAGVLQPPGNPATPPPHRRLLPPRADVAPKPSSRYHGRTRTHVRVCTRSRVHTNTRMTREAGSRTAEEFSRKIASVSYMARARARFYLPSENVDCVISLPLNRTRSFLFCVSVFLSPSRMDVVETDDIGARSSWRFLVLQNQGRGRWGKSERERREEGE